MTGVVGAAREGRMPSDTCLDTAFEVARAVCAENDTRNISTLLPQGEPTDDPRIAKLKDGPGTAKHSVAQEDAALSSAIWWTGLKGMTSALGWIVLYLGTGVAVYTWGGMEPLDAIYFCIVTLTTVGYGDLTPRKTMAKTFTCLYILVGVALIGTLLSQVIEILLDNQEQLLLAMVEEDKQMANQGSTRMMVKESQEKRIRDNIRTETLKVLNGLGLLLLLLLVGALVFMHFEGLNIVDACYLTIVSASTVGYGDYHPSSISAKVFAVFFLPLGTLLLAKIISDYTELRVQRRTMERQHRMLMAAISREEFSKMDTDGDGKISRLEYMVRTLIVQGKIAQEDVDDIDQRFDELDKDEDGTLETIEIIQTTPTST